jgi:metal-responsive CopG/Arc/MetJ family transcriptional regulator
VIRVPDKLWSAAMQRADERGETVSEAVRKFLERYSRAEAREESAAESLARVEMVAREHHDCGEQCAPEVLLADLLAALTGHRGT